MNELALWIGVPLVAAMAFIWFGTTYRNLKDACRMTTGEQE